MHNTVFIIVLPINQFDFSNLIQEQNGQSVGREADTKDNSERDKMLKVKKSPDTSISQAVCAKMFNTNE